MVERGPRIEPAHEHETFQRGDLLFLNHPGTEDVFSGYGLILQPGRRDVLAGLLMVDRPNPVDPRWLDQVKDAFGDYQLLPMTASGERGILCRMLIEPNSLQHLQSTPSMKNNVIQEALQPLLDQPPNPVLRLHWDTERRMWLSQIQKPAELPEEIRSVFKEFGYGCLAVESDIGVVHVCYAADTDIASFSDQPVISQWQLIKMPTAPLIRLELTILDKPDNPYQFESFLNLADEEQANILAELANQDQLYLSFYGDDLDYRYTKTIPQDVQQWQKLDELIVEAENHWSSIPPERRDFDQAKAAFMQRFI